MTDITQTDDSAEVTGERRSRPTPLDYTTLFEQCPGGPQILEELVSLFGGAAYVHGGLEADRETCFRAGKQEVVNYILNRINQGYQG